MQDQPLIMVLAALSVATAYDGLRNARHFTNIWVAHIPGGPEEAQLVATKFGYDYDGEVRSFDNHYILRKRDHPTVLEGPSPHHTMSLLQDDKVVWAEQQYAKLRVKRSVPQRMDFASSLSRSLPHRIDLSALLSLYESADTDSMQRCFSWMSSPYKSLFNDAVWTNQWYLIDYRTRKTDPHLDLNVVPCYMEGITGKGVRVVVIDDGLEWKHEDLRRNYDPSISTDLNDGDEDPTPRYDANDSNSHGTRCAGEIAMQANNSVCGVGVAFNAWIGGIRVLDGTTTDYMEGQALQFALDKVDIYTSSWGPSDDGRTMEAPGFMARQAIKNGSLKGRNGKGAIYIFASGNGKPTGDSCAADGYIQNIYTVAIASASQTGKSVYYGETCSAIMATAYSSGSTVEEMVATTDVRGSCCTTHTGTSASAPLAGGILALGLEANPSLTWRDVQYLIALTCEIAPLAHNDGWILNGANLYVSNTFGFGLMNAYNLVRLAKQWTNVPSKSVCTARVDVSERLQIPAGQRTEIPILTDGCANTENEVNYLEHVELTCNIIYFYRGGITVSLTSPSGTTSLLLPYRPMDYSTTGLQNWTLTSVQFWGERPKGTWSIGIFLEDLPSEQHHYGYPQEFTLTLHGPKDQPKIYEKGPRKYEQFTLKTEDNKPRRTDSTRYRRKRLLDDVRNELYLDVINEWLN